MGDLFLERDAVISEAPPMPGETKLFRCNSPGCGRTFASAEAKRKHKLDKHQPHRRYSAADRPMERGQIACGYPNCGALFKTEWNAAQHRRDIHGEIPHAR